MVAKYLSQLRRLAIKPPIKIRICSSSVVSRKVAGLNPIHSGYSGGETHADADSKESANEVRSNFCFGCHFTL